MILTITKRDVPRAPPVKKRKEKRPSSQRFTITTHTLGHARACKARVSETGDGPILTTRTHPINAVALNGDGSRITLMTTETHAKQAQEAQEVKACKNCHEARISQGLHFCTIHPTWKRVNPESSCSGFRSWKHVKEEGIRVHRMLLAFKAVQRVLHKHGITRDKAFVIALDLSDYLRQDNDISRNQGDTTS